MKQLYKISNTVSKTIVETTLYENAHISLSHNTITFSYYCDGWLHINKNRLKESTYIKYQTIIEKHIKSVLGNYDITTITTKVIENFSQKLLEKYSPETVKTILVLTQSILKYAEKHFPGLSASIVIVYPKTYPKETRVLSQEEQQIFVDYLFEDINFCKFGILLSLSTGIRIGELCALKVENINRKNRTVVIRFSMQRLKNSDKNATAKTKIHIDTPKTQKSFRVIPLTDTLFELFEKLDYVEANAFILTGTSNYMEPRTLQYRLTKYLKDCNLEEVHFHTLRHTFATRCVEVGFEIKSLSEILGHSSTNITLNRYVHSSLDLKRENMSKLSIL